MLAKHPPFIQTGSKPKNKPLYQYVITLDRPIFPRRLAEELAYDSYVSTAVQSVTDLQCSDHYYGATYTVPRQETR